jgi:hypothetical protein
MWRDKRMPGRYHCQAMAIDRKTDIYTICKVEEMSGRRGTAGRVQIPTTRLDPVQETVRALRKRRGRHGNARRGAGTRPAAGPRGPVADHVSVTPAWQICVELLTAAGLALRSMGSRELILSRMTDGWPSLAGSWSWTGREDGRAGGEEQQFPFRPLQQWMETDPVVHGIVYRSTLVTVPYLWRGWKVRLRSNTAG